MLEWVETIGGSLWSHKSAGRTERQRKQQVDVERKIRDRLGEGNGAEAGEPCLQYIVRLKYGWTH